MSDTGSEAPDTDVDADIDPPGRPVVLEPTPPGLWQTLLGTGVAVLAPLFGFLIGGMIGTGAVNDAVGPMYLSLFAGIVLGGIGVLVALTGGARLWRHSHRGTGVDH